jgi:hypothetical protein
MAVTSLSGSESGAVPLRCPLCAESPFARLRCYLLRRDVLRPVRESYPSFIAHTGSCARPKPSSCLGVTLVHQVLCRLLRAPAGRWPFPTLSLQSLRRCLDPYPAVFSWCSCSLLPRRQRPHLRRHKFGTPNHPCNATSTGNYFRGCSHSLMFRLPRSLDPQVAPTAEA